MAAEASPPGSPEKPRPPVREAGCQWEAAAAVEAGCQSDVAVQTDPPSRRPLRRRAGPSGAPLRPRAPNGRREAAESASEERAAPPAADVSPSGARPRRTRRLPKWREDPPTSSEEEVPPGGATAVKSEAETVVCDVCGQVMKNKSSLARHSFIHTGQKPFACHLCDLRFNRQDNLRYHLSRLHPGGAARRERRRPGPTWLCHVCGKIFRCRSALRTHEVIHLGIKPHRCDLCPKAYMRANDLEHHRATVHGDDGEAEGAPRRPGSLLCHFCGKELKFRSQLAAHLLTHTDERPHLCDVCGRKFSRRHQMERHKLLHVDGGAPPCEVCGKRLKTEALLAAHLRLHSADEPFRCGRCPRRFAGPARLERHVSRVHPGESGGAASPRAGRARPPKAFPCATCGKEFKFPSLLSTHAAVHSEERPHACDFCPRRFRRTGHLKRHRRVVHLDGARPPQNFVCHVCGEDKKCRSQLARHVIIHTGERPFACDLCSARFNRRGNLRQHRKRVHGVDETPREDDPPLVFDDLDEDAAPAD
ncbi:zinc finger protein 616-like [Corythoichthys intestinalis]|uniref:zinc finger protein 616-like n=1 Tax=Corythoichthys intestinalis TaxID=161448 RepID=UPI0025A58DF8|nr:zinc finger protein 616-like [Corythoichthys intestinalis]